MNNSTLPSLKGCITNHILLFCVLFLVVNSYAADSDYHIIKRIEVGGEGGWDYLTVDSEARRLHISRSTHVTALDLNTDKVGGDLPDTPGVHGIAMKSWRSTRSIQVYPADFRWMAVTSRQAWAWMRSITGCFQAAITRP